MDWGIGKRGTLKGSFIVLLTGLAGSLFAANGQLILVNSLGVVVNGSLGGSASNVKVQVYDSIGICSTTSSLAYGGVVVVPWNSANTHSSTKCTNIVSVDVSALKTASGVIQYDSIANATPPTTPVANVALIVTGNASPAMVNSGSYWGSGVGVPPIYLTSNGSISVTGVMGAVGVQGIKAEAHMLRYGIRPAGRLLTRLE